MPSPVRRILLPVMTALCVGLAAGWLALPQTPHAAPPLRALIVGGGPDREHNQVAIESNVRYVRRLLPPGTVTRVLFASGDPKSVNVQYLDPNDQDRYRASLLSNINGANRLPAFDANFHALTAQSSGPLLLYFTGHGSPGDDDTYDNNDYDMWGGDALSVRRLAAHIDQLPAGTPVTLVMVECYSGAFGNLIFTGGDPRGAPTDKDLCGFFASVPAREAAGCTDEVNEANYRDFTSYFFAALSGTDRLGHPATGADYNHDGVVCMNEAYAYALIHDVSIDTPTCTSDVFLRRYATVTDSDVFQIGYSQTRAWAAPAQRAALDALSQQLRLTGEHRLSVAYSTFANYSREDLDSDDANVARTIRLVRLAKSVVLAHLLQESSNTALKARFAVLLQAEARNPLR